MNYITGSSFNEDKNNIIIIKNNTYYLPLIHIFKEFPNNIIFKCIVNKLQVNTKNELVSESMSINTINPTQSHSEVPVSELTSESVSESSSSNADELQENQTTNEIKSIKEEIKKHMLTKRNTIRALSSFKLKELVDLCNLYHIDVIENGKPKNKKMLYDSIIEVLDN